MSKEKDEKKALFEVIYENGMTKEQYRRFRRQYPVMYVWTSILQSLMLIAIVLISSLLSDYSIWIFFLLSLAIIIFSFIFNYFRFDKLSDVEYEKYPDLKRSKRYVFYNDYIFMDNGVSTHIIEHSRVQKCVETDDDFFIQLFNDTKIICLSKDLIDKEQEKHIREISKNVYFNRTKNFKKNNSEYKKNLIGKILLIVFTVLTLLSVAVIIVTENIILDKYMFREMGPSLFWLYIWLMPIPFICLLLGFGLSKKYKTVPSIIIGIFVFFTLINFATEEYQYQEKQRNVKNMETYIELIDAEVDDVLFLQQEKLSLNIDGVDVSGLKTTFEIILDVRKTVEEQISKGNNWINLKDINDNVKDFIYIDDETEKEQYGFIYVEETEKYNEIPIDNGTYHIYSISFSTNDFVIYEFDYEVNN